MRAGNNFLLSGERQPLHKPHRICNSWAMVDNGDGCTALRGQSLYKNERVAKRVDVDRIYVIVLHGCLIAETTDSSRHSRLF